MAMGRFGQIVGPLIAGALLGAGWTADRIMMVIASGGLIAAVFVIFLNSWLTKRNLQPAAGQNAAGLLSA
jgi:hypothetical protein